MMKTPLLELKDISKEFRKGKQIFHAIKNFSLSILKGQTVGLGGESGCGKSTLANLIMQFIKPTFGSIFFNGKPLESCQKKIQMIFQQPGGSLNPRMNVREILSEPLIITGSIKYDEREKYLNELLLQVGLSSNLMSRLPWQLSGGQKQRVAIARALTINPELLICDEPFSALDISMQVQIIKLLSGLQRDRGLTYLIISHDLSILRYLSHRLAIMYLGHLVEWGPTNSVYEDPIHPYSRGLISSILKADPMQKTEHSRESIKGEIPSSMTVSTGCPFFKRCPVAKSVCEKTVPLLREVRQEHFVACHFA